MMDRVWGRSWIAPHLESIPTFLELGLSYYFYLFTFWW
jgi:hypothetical protein